MSDSRLPLETTDREDDRAQPQDQRLGELDTSDQVDAPGDGSPIETPEAAAPDGANGLAPHEDVPLAAGSPPEVNDAAAEHVQPTLDLRFPEPPPAPADWPAEIAEPVSPLVPAPRLESLYVLPTEPPSDPSGGHASPPAETLMPAENLMEVSPIFSALDAAETAASEAQQAHAPTLEPAEYVIPLPYTPALDDHTSEPPAPLVAMHPIDEATPDDPPLQPEVSLTAPPADEQPEPARQLHDAAAKIALEADATAEALESLKRLLNNKLPLLDSPPIPAPAPILARPPAPPSIPTYQAPPRPVTPPPMMSLAPAASLTPLAEDAPMRRRPGVGGFLAGFALSWVFGAMLYAYLTLLG